MNNVALDLKNNDFKSRFLDPLARHIFSTLVNMGSISLSQQHQEAVRATPTFPHILHMHRQSLPGQIRSLSQFVLLKNRNKRCCWSDLILCLILTGLQDNPWVCDCSLYEMVHFLNFQSPNIAFIEPRLKCFTPRSLAGVSFSQVELRKCQSPVVHTSVAKVKTILGSTVLLRCGTTGMPIPELSWRRADGAQLNGTGGFGLSFSCTHGLGEGDLHLYFLQAVQQMEAYIDN